MIYIKVSFVQQNDSFENSTSDAIPLVAANLTSDALLFEEATNEPLIDGNEYFNGKNTIVYDYTYYYEYKAIVLDFSEEALANYTYEYYLEPDEDEKNEDITAQTKEDMTTTQTKDVATVLETSQDPASEALVVPEEPPEASPADKKAAYEKE